MTRAVAAVAVGLALLVGAMVWRVGSWAYPLDDAYIHLQMADAYAAGLPGVGVGSSASASSSLLWPFLLVPGVLTPVAVFVPLLASCAGSLVLAAVCTRAAGDWRLGVAVAVASHALSLGVLGMEHSAQVALTAAVALGLVETDRTGRMPRWLLVAIVVLPLLRYEGLAVSVAALAWLSDRRGSLLAALALAVVLVGATLLLHAATGQWLPASVLSKRAMYSAAWSQAWQPALFLPACIGLMTVWRGRKGWGLLVLAVVAAHAAGGQVGMFTRHLAYLMPWALILGGYALRDELRDAWATERRAVVLGGALLATPALYQLAYLPGSAEHVAELHGSMRAIADAVGPVAVNDVGVVGWRSASPPLDLAGLADSEALGHVLREDVAWIGPLAEERGAVVAMVFPSWFPELPADWTPIATLSVRRNVFQDDPWAVIVYATEPRDVAGLRQILAGLDLRGDLEILPASNVFLVEDLTADR